MSKAHTPDPVMELCGASPVTCLAFEEHEMSNEQPLLLSGHQDGMVICWSLKFQRAVSSHAAHLESVLWLLCPRPGVCISQGREGVLKIWRVQGLHWDLVGQIPTAPFLFCNSSLLNCTHHNLLITPNDETSAISIHRLPSDFTPFTEPSKTLCSAFSPSFSCRCSQRLVLAEKKTFGMCMKMCAFKLGDEEKLRLVVAYESGLLGLWDLKSLALLSKIKAFSDSVMCVDVCATKSPDVLRVSAGSVDTSLRSWLLSDDDMAEDHCISITNPGLGCIAARRDGRILATGGWDGMCRVFTAAKLRPLAVLANHKESVQCVAFARDNRLATASKDGYITLWNVYAER